ncbi:hypothetical protein AJ79_00572 [Helicocarpus griseus UAMH5409]|uniref:Zn(2)-C6 fungal-type domain-containing protein n=1 Tax=Helicocarpus griseus UAMH5409 TaxID=1447875 RepID=A0A2B7YB22_9EURO|nr:hypothetical protein AJ79_00572 [Helicocarpus griseus UAMH5409]
MDPSASSYMTSGPQQAQGQPPFYPYDENAVNELLKRKRRKRTIKSCYPCRTRKVKCEPSARGDACVQCIRRDHADLCQLPVDQMQQRRGFRIDFETNNQSPEASPVLGQQLLNVAAAGSGGNFVSTGSVDVGQPEATSNSQAARLQSLEEEISALRADLARGGVIGSNRNHTGEGGPYTAISPLTNSQDVYSPSQSRPPSLKRGGRQVVENATGARIYLGSDAEPALLLGCRHDVDYGMPGLDTLGQLAPTTYPFANIWRPEVSLSEIFQTLPSDSDVMRYWQVYRDSVYPFYPVLVDIEKFEVDLCNFLDDTISRENAFTSNPNIDISWLSLLFAVLASGAQFSNDSSKDRDLRSKVFVCSSFQCLRAANLFYTSSADQIQTLLLLGNCIRNNPNTNAAWILVGTTARLAQSIGLHEQSVSSDDISPSNALDEYQKSRLWWMVVWQDTHLSFSYDRPQSSMVMNRNIPYSSPSTYDRSFVDSILTLCWIIRDRAHRNLINGEVDASVETTLSYKRSLEDIFRDASPFLTDKASCKTLQNHLERLALGIHVGYVICRICRLCVERTSASSQMHAQILSDCSERAMHVVENFLDLRRLAANVCRSWGFVQNAVSCAVMLGMSTGEPEARYLQTKPLVERLIGVLERDEKESQWRDNDTNIRHSGPYSRALIALRKVYGLETRDELTELDQIDLH